MNVRIKRLALVLLILLACVGCDQATKAAARTYLASSPPISYAGGIFLLQYAENNGAFLSLGSALSEHMRFTLFIIVSGAAVLGMLIFVLVQKKLSAVSIVGFSLVVAGGIGNLIDRIFNAGVVTDFMNIGIGRLRTGIFNIADVIIMGGVAVLLFHAMLGKDGDRDAAAPDSPGNGG